MSDALMHLLKLYVEGLLILKFIEIGAVVGVGLIVVGCVISSCSK